MFCFHLDCVELSVHRLETIKSSELQSSGAVLSHRQHHEDLGKSLNHSAPILSNTVVVLKYFQVFLSLLSLVYSAPAPQDETLEAVPYVHKEIEALPYEHDPTGG